MNSGGDNASWTVLANTGNIKINLGTNRYINRIQFFVGNIGLPLMVSESNGTDISIFIGRLHIYNNIHTICRQYQVRIHHLMNTTKHFRQSKPQYIQITVSNSAAEVGLLNLDIRPIHTAEIVGNRRDVIVRLTGSTSPTLTPTGTNVDTGVSGIPSSVRRTERRRGPKSRAAAAW